MVLYLGEHRAAVGQRLLGHLFDSVLDANDEGVVFSHVGCQGFRLRCHCFHLRVEVVDLVQGRRCNGALEVLQLCHHCCMEVLHLVLEGLRRHREGGSAVGSAIDPVLQNLQALVTLDLRPLSEQRAEAVPKFLAKCMGIQALARGIGGL